MSHAIVPSATSDRGLVCLARLGSGNNMKAQRSHAPKLRMLYAVLRSTRDRKFDELS
jgi:hypothetical protein